MGLKLKNDAVSRIASGISSTNTTITLVPGSGTLFPVLSSGDYFPATLIKSDGSREIIRVTGRSTDVLTVVRAQEGTVAQSFNANDRIELRATSETLEQLIGTSYNGIFPVSTNTTINKTHANKFIHVNEDATLTIDVSTLFIGAKLTFVGNGGDATIVRQDAGTIVSMGLFTATSVQLKSGEGISLVWDGVSLIYENSCLNVKANILNYVYPVGSVYINAASITNPAELLGIGTWDEIGAGRVLVGQNTSDGLFDAIGETGGSKDAIVVEHSHTGSTGASGAHNHSVNDPTHSHQQQTIRENSGGRVTDHSGSDTWEGYAFRGDYTAAASTGISINGVGDHTHTVTVGSTGQSGANANIQPYLVVKMWKRTA